MMDFRTIRSTFLDFFQGHGHAIVPSSSLVPHNDPTLLFTNAGMVQFKNLFLGEEKASYTRAATSQKCVRAGGKHNDLDNVGYTPRHHTFFEMLGNFSFGDYFKQEAIEWAWELLTRGYGLPPEKLHASVYLEDDEAYGIWEKQIGLPPERIVRLGEKDNFWAMGDTGPCGPCSEIHIDQGPAVGCGEPDCGPGCECSRFLEIWNLVFTQFDRAVDGTLAPLPRPNIDTGMGLERLAAVVQGVRSNYDTDLFRDLIRFIEKLCQKPYGQDPGTDVAFRVIADHSRAAAFLIGDGILPSNEGRGYVLRRILRRAIRFGQGLAMPDIFLKGVCGQVIGVMGEDYPELIQARGLIEGVVQNEERRFADTLSHGMKVLDEEIRKLKDRSETILPGETAFKLYDTYGLNLDMVEDVAREEALTVDTEGYQRSMHHRRTTSQESWKGSGEEEIPEAYRTLLGRGLDTRFMGYETLQTDAAVIGLVVQGKEVQEVGPGQEADVLLDVSPFYAESGGQAGDGGWVLAEGGTTFEVKDVRKYGQGLFVQRGVLQTGRLCPGMQVHARVDEAKRMATARNHSATHLLHGALREVLGDHVKQAGSLVAEDRLRFDFSHFTQVSRERLDEIERMVNAHVRANLPVLTHVMARQEAMKTGAMAIFEERYGDQVRVVQMGDGVSRELCGGTHVERTGDIGFFRIIHEGAVAANLRRIEALTGEGALRHVQERDETLRMAASLVKAMPEGLCEKIERLLAEVRDRAREMETLKARLLTGGASDFQDKIRKINGVQVLAMEVEASSPKELRDAGDRFKDRLQSGIVLLASKAEGKLLLTCMVSKDLTGQFHAGKIIGRLSEVAGGKGGGRPDMAQGGGNQPERLPQVFEALDEYLGA